MNSMQRLFAVLVVLASASLQAQSTVVTVVGQRHLPHDAPAIVYLHQQAPRTVLVVDTLLATPVDLERAIESAASLRHRLGADTLRGELAAVPTLSSHAATLTPAARRRLEGEGKVHMTALRGARMRSLSGLGKVRSIDVVVPTRGRDR